MTFVRVSLFYILCKIKIIINVEIEPFFDHCHMPGLSVLSVYILSINLPGFLKIAMHKL
jgi:hypothetical protein